MAKMVCFISVLLLSWSLFGGEDASSPIAPRKTPLPIVKLDGQATYTLDSGEQCHAEAPKTFYLPPLKERQSLKKGELVKLIFRLTDGKKVQVERMWVRVISVNEKGYTGTLNNDPYCTETIKSGIEVQFEAKHVIQIDTHEPEVK